MPQNTIEVEDLGKCYRLGETTGFDRTLRDTITDTFRSTIERVTGKQQKHTERPTHWALRHVNFQVSPGDVLGVIGRNGAGKSTLLKILSRITDPTEGRARLYGRISSLLEVGTGFHPELTGRENIYLNGTILGMRKAEIDQKFDQIVEFSEISKFLDTPVKRYSSGMYVRLAFAVSAHLDPEILVVDEVLAVGDVKFQEKCLGKMQDVAGHGRTVLFVSHNMGAISKLCNKAILLEKGQVAFSGDVDQAICRYLETAEGSDSGYVDLEHANGWETDRDPHVLWASVHNDNDEQKGHFHTGENMTFKIGYKLHEPIRAGFCQIDFHNALGERVMTVNNTHRHGPIPLSQEGVLTCHLKDVRLASGEYIIGVGIGTASPARHYVDYILSTLNIKMHLMDYLGHEQLAPGQGPIAQRSLWELQRPVLNAA